MLRHRLDGGDRGAEDRLLDRLAIAVELLERVGETACFVPILREDELERGVGSTEPSRRIDPRREPEPDRACVDGGRIDPGAPHQRLQARAARGGERLQPGGREAAVLVEQRHDVGDRRHRDEVQVPAEERVLGAEERLAELVDDARPTSSGKG